MQESAKEKMSVKYLNQWLDCGDDKLREHRILQDKINEAKNTFFYRMKEQGVSDYQLWLCYERWVNSNRERLKMVGSVGVEPTYATVKE